MSLATITVTSVAGVASIAWILRDQQAASWAWAPPGLPAAGVVWAASMIVMLVLMGSIVLEAVSLVPHIHARARAPMPRHDGSMRVTVVIPAHNEAATLPFALKSLREQSRRADRIVVIADKCCDGTPEIARQRGCSVLETRGNHGRKAGALNQAIARMLPALDARDLLLIMDADTRLSPEFISEAAAIIEGDRDMAAVGGSFIGDSRVGLLAQLQRNEFSRYARQIASRRGRVFVLTGTATVFRATALEEVARQRGAALPGQRGKVYDETAITEDNELTLALKSLGAHVVSPPKCTVITETMPTLPALWTQRLRWQRGALDNLSDYGLRASTARYWMQQWGLAYGSVALPTSLVALILVPVILGQWVLLPFWLAVTAAFSLERGLTAWDAGWRGRLLGFSLIPEIAYSLFLQACFIGALASMVSARELPWGHLTEPVAEGALP